MTGKVVSEHATIEIMQNGTARSLDLGSDGNDAVKLTNVQVAVTVTFGVAVLQVGYLAFLVISEKFKYIFQLVMYVLRLGAVSSLLSDNLVSGFTCASAFHVASSQLKDLLGLTMGKRRGNFSFVYVSITCVYLRFKKL